MTASTPESLGAAQVPTWVFCWTTKLGRVALGARDTTFNGRPVPYAPRRHVDDGILWLRPGTERPAEGSRGFRLGVQGSISRFACFVGGYVIGGHVVPACHGPTLVRLRELADRAVLEGRARWWTSARVGFADGSTRDGVVVDDAATARELAGAVGAPSVLELRDDIDRVITHFYAGGEPLPEPTEIVTRENVRARSAADGRLLAAWSLQATFESLTPPGDATDPVPLRRPLRDPRKDRP